MGELRWRLAEDDGGQGSLFDADSLLDRHVGTGEFAGIEFLHVNAKRVINRVPEASRVPFRYTINAYRGCSHACVYCATGSTPILMADSSSKPLAEVRPGDIVMGTRIEGSYRRLVASMVLDHWPVVRRAFETRLSDGRRLVTSADHRFLSDRGWKYVTGSEHGTGRRPHLTLNDRLLGVGPAASAPECGRDYTLGCSIRACTRPGVVSIADLGVEETMYDITTETGDYISDGVISHNCFARPTHEYLGLDSGKDFETKIVVKINAVERVRAELASRRWSGEPIAMGTNTDPYQRCEGKYHLTRGIIEALLEAGNPFSILTKSTLILRDKDLLAEAARRGLAHVSFSIGTLDEAVWKETEPGTPHPRQRVAALGRLVDAGVPCGVLVAPIIPGLSDRPEQVEAVKQACAAAGASSVSSIRLHLRRGVKEHYLDWLEQAHPELMGQYRRLYGSGADLREERRTRRSPIRRPEFRTGHEPLDPD